MWRRLWRWDKMQQLPVHVSKLRANEPWVQQSPGEMDNYAFFFFSFWIFSSLPPIWENGPKCGVLDGKSCDDLSSGKPH